MERGTDACPGPMTLTQAEDEYRIALSHRKGEQYELLPPPPQIRYIGTAPSSNIIDSETSRLYGIRHIIRSGPTNVTALGIYYVLDGVIYKSPSVRALMKATVSRTIQGLEDASDILSGCAFYEPAAGYTWNFEAGKNTKEEENEEDIFNQMKIDRGKRRRRVLNNRRRGERTDEEEEAIRAKEKINTILLRLRNQMK